jgi:hypothetical protein
MPFRQWFVEWAATRMRETIAPTSFERLTATFARLGDFSNRNIKIKYSKSVQNCLQESSPTGDLPQLHMALSAVLSKRRVDERRGLPARLVYRRRFTPWQKLNSIGSYIPRRVQIVTRFESLPGAGKEERCGAFCGFPTAMRNPAQLLTYVPELNICAEHVGNF